MNPSLLSSYLRLIRPKQWIKNVFVFAPLIFARELFSLPQVLLAFRAFAAFSLAAATIYIVNDVLDAPADRNHPVKKHRPIASGAITVSQALAFLVVIALGVVALLWGMTTDFILVVVAYVAMNLLYSFRLKDVVLLDVFVIAAGFMLRVLGGAFAINVHVSSWIVLCSLFVSLFLGFAKRRGEIIFLQESGIKQERKVLALYRIDFLDQMLTIAAAGAVISYALYTVAPRTVEIFGTERLIYTTVLVCYGLFRYLFLTHTTAATENPTNAVTSDLPILITGLLWIASCIFIIYTSAPGMPQTMP